MSSNLVRVACCPSREAVPLHKGQAVDESVDPLRPHLATGLVLENGRRVTTVQTTPCRCGAGFNQGPGKQAGTPNGFQTEKGICSSLK